MASRAPHLFEALAQKLGVTESDFLLLKRYGMVNAYEFYYRLPASADLEEYLRTVAFPECAFMENQNIVLFQRSSQDQSTWAEWKRDGGAAALRKLWEASKLAA